MPTNGGRWVIDLNMGTKIRPPTPSQNTVLRWPSEKLAATVAVPKSALAATSPLRCSDRRYAGTTTETNEGMNSSLITPAAVISPLFQSIMVVTSPMGENAPPELAAMMMSEA